MQTFTPATGASNPHVQTLLPRMIRKQALFAPLWESFTTDDGDFVDLAWSEDWQNEAAKLKPIFVLFHGLEGSFNSPYANGLMHAFAEQGWLSVMMHFRGCSGKPNKLARAYHSGETEDARQVLESIHQRFPNSSKVALGVSLGGNMLTNYLAKYDSNPIVNAATIVSAPLDLGACSVRIEQGFSKVYRTYLLSSMKKNALKKSQLLEQALGIKELHIQKLTRLYEFDDLITAPLHGYQDAADYYRRCSGIQRICDISTPLQIIHAKDDPFMTDAVIPTFKLPSNIDYRLFEQGGHVGFITGSIFKPRFWLEEAMPAYYSHFLES
ncbi:hydrolase [Vibrio maerlii]|uniref:hydrolase n=1 Tax=Vibrio maerlii TaxID=2231648 RepID=UPI000E3EBB04|nr:hydrolase [Vibrio maerlii]